MALAKNKTMTRMASVSYDVGKYKSAFFHATPAANATVLTAGYFNEMRADLQVNDLILCMSVADGTGVANWLKVTAVPAAPGDVTVANCFGVPA